MVRIVVGVDGSAGARRALEWAADEAVGRAATLVVVHAYPPAHAEAGQRLAADFDVRKAAEELVAAAFRDARARHPGLAVEPVVRVVRDSPARALVDEAADAAMLVVGSRGHGGFMALLVGSIGQHCVTHARCPVVVVPGPRGAGGGPDVGQEREREPVGV